MMRPEQEIWGDMLTVSQRGFLRWNEDIARKAGGDPRENPERYMVMCGNLRTLDNHNPTLDADGLEEISPNHLAAPNGEITGVNGLLRLSDRFPISLDKPKDILVVGAVTPNSMLSVLKWAKHKNWDQSHVTLVDKSPVPITTLEKMQHGGYFDWPGGVSLIQDDILKHAPTRQPQVVVADILNTWMVDTFQYPHIDKASPYDAYKTFLRWGADTVKNGGLFLSRCMIAPPRQRRDPNILFHQDAKSRAEKVIFQLGALANRANHDAIQDMVEELFEDPPLATFCGLSSVSKYYGHSRPNAGRHAINVFRRLHQRAFPVVHEIQVDDQKSGFTFLNFACGVMA